MEGGREVTCGASRCVLLNPGAPVVYPRAVALQAHSCAYPIEQTEFVCVQHERKKTPFGRFFNLVMLDQLQ
jgi:hypothetical protein